MVEGWRGLVFRSTEDLNILFELARLRRCWSSVRFHLACLSFLFDRLPVGTVHPKAGRLVSHGIVRV
jgi:hypothetical protein